MLVSILMVELKDINNWDSFYIVRPYLGSFCLISHAFVNYFFNYSYQGVDFAGSSEKCNRCDEGIQSSRNFKFGEFFISVYTFSGFKCWIMNGAFHQFYIPAWRCYGNLLVLFLNFVKTRFWNSSVFQYFDGMAC